ncbi:MAG TPA: hypothetical protein VF043_21925 [Ktedonobacteraceae bacterium]
MRDAENDQPQDDFEIEITNLDAQDQTIAGNKATSSPKPFIQSLNYQFLLRHRGLQLLITSGVVALAMLVILGSTAGIRSLLSGGTESPLPTPATSSRPRNDLFYFQLNPPWGHLSIDGHTVARMPVDSTDPPLSLSPGQHKLLWQAAPFRPVSCILVVPVISNPSTCNHSQFTPENTNQLISIVELRVSTDLLPATRRTALLAATQAALDKEQHSQTVLAGESYAVPSEIAGPGHKACRLEKQVVLCFTTTKQQLQATLRFQLDTDITYGAPCSDGQACSYNGFDCRLFCSLTDGQWPDSPPVVPPASAWGVVVPVHSFWQFTTATGQVVAGDEADNFVGGIENEHLVALEITWDGVAWRVSVLPANSQGFFSVPVCDSALGDAQNLVNNVIINNVQISTSYQFAYGNDPSAGCLIEVAQEQVPYVTPTPTSSPPVMAYLLHRFGVLVAANAQAHHLWPFLPIADENEQHIVQQLIPLLGQ